MREHPRRVCAARWEMRDVIVTTYEQSVGSDGLMQDSVTFEFERMVNSYFVPNPAGGTDVETRTDFNFGTGMPISSPALSTTNYMSTAPDVRSTMEFGFGQLPLLGYAFAVTGSPPSTSGAHFVATASVDGVALWSRLARQQMFNTGVYQNRDAQRGR